MARFGLFGAPRKMPNVDTRGMGILPDASRWTPPIASMESGVLPGDQPQVGQMPSRRGLFGGKFNAPGGWAEKLWALGGIVRGDPNAAGDYHAIQQRRAELNARQQLAEAQRQNDWQDWLRKAQWERANPKPTSNDTVADFEFIRQRLGEKEAEEFLRNKANPPVYRVGPDGQFYRVDVAQPQVLGTELPEGWTIQGGSGGNAAGGFRP